MSLGPEEIAKVFKFMGQLLDKSAAADVEATRLQTIEDQGKVYAEREKAFEQRKTGGRQQVRGRQLVAKGEKSLKGARVKEAKIDVKGTRSMRDVPRHERGKTPASTKRTKGHRFIETGRRKIVEPKGSVKAKMVWKEVEQPRGWTGPRDPIRVPTGELKITGPQHPKTLTRSQKWSRFVDRIAPGAAQRQSLMKKLGIIETGTPATQRSAARAAHIVDPVAKLPAIVRGAIRTPIETLTGVPRMLLRAGRRAHAAGIGHDIHRALGTDPVTRHLQEMADRPSTKGAPKVRGTAAISELRVSHGPRVTRGMIGVEAGRGGEVIPEKSMTKGAKAKRFFGGAFGGAGRTLPIIAGADDLTVVTKDVQEGDWTGFGLHLGDAILGSFFGLYSEIPGLAIEHKTGRRNRGLFSGALGYLGIEEETESTSAIEDIITSKLGKDSTLDSAWWSGSSPEGKARSEHADRPRTKSPPKDSMWDAVMAADPETPEGTELITAFLDVWPEYRADPDPKSERPLTQEEMDMRNRGY